MALGARFESAAAATAATLTITYSSNEPTATSAISVANGSFISTAEAIVAIEALVTQVNALNVDIADIRTKFNKGP